MERLTVPADNNCLFACVGYQLIDRSRHHGRGLRQLVADEVQRNPETYSAAVLEKPPREYIAWILRDTTWGGGVELSILASHFRCELAAIEVRTQTVYVFGESGGFTRRAYLVWDGIHYDMIVRSNGDGTHETVFSPSDSAAKEGALQVVRELHSSRQFTDTSNFTLMCLEDNVPLRGQEEAVRHARLTGHTNFAECVAGRENLPC